MNELLALNDTNTTELINRALNWSEVYKNCGNKPTTPGYCPEVFDKMLYFMLHSELCWPESPPGSVVNHSCPKIPHLSFDPSNLAYKECWENGTWFRKENDGEWANYSQCVNKEELEFLTFINRLHVIGYSVSLAALVISLCIFVSFRTLRCTRIRIHTQLFTSFILNNIMWILWYEKVIPDLEVTWSNPVWCQALHIVKEYFMVANYMWMLCEGLHLHLALVVVFVREERTMKWFFVIGWGIPVVIVAVHSLVRVYVTEDTFMCWLEEMSYSSWFLSVPVLIILSLCTVFLINVLRVILTIMHPNSPNPAPVGIRRAARAALILIPLFGLQFILLPMVPAQQHPLYHFYMWLCLVIVPFQGLCCSCLFCFANQDVHQALKGFVHRRMYRSGRWSNYHYTGAVDSAGVYVVNGNSQSRRKSTDTTRL
ncbi:calcitonin receptor-like [Anoplophora glabripennis]|uniref:calcitonin receptor-like n=1 Tax=Anoplophora glabripennis TaxID=217634 RepID=UPI0008753242|nr:calcitonin receptor-like [Anoplophora glabripennis]